MKIQEDKGLTMENIFSQEKVIVIDFGGQYNQLVARRVRECNVYCEIYSYRTDIEQIKAMNPKGIILTGGPNSCYEPDSPTYTKELFELGIPVLGLCYGAQLMMHMLGGKVDKAPVREYGKTEVMVDTTSPLFGNVAPTTICWMSHFDYISKPAPGFNIVAHTADCPVAAAENREKNLYAIQFHPEVLHTEEGSKMLHNFVRGVCGCAGTWRMDSFVESTIKDIREKVGDGKVLLALSGGVDSSVAAGLLSRAIGKQLTCVFVDHGLLRKNEGDEVESVFGPNGQFDLNFIRVNAQERYYSKLAGVTEPEQKRKIIGEEFIRVFEEEAKKIGAVDFLAQGTIYPDVVESGLGGESAVIKSHHNVGGLPDFVDFKEIIEPLRNLFKDEVRKAGLELGIPEFGTDFAMQMVIDAKPTEFSDLIRISGLSHGTDVWLGNAHTLIEQGIATISTAICTRDDIMIYLISMGLDSEQSFTIMESVRKGKGLKEEWKEEMRAHNVPEWYIDSCLKIKYMFPKAHAAAYVMMAWRIAYCKVFYPLAYYAAYFSIRATGFNYEIMCQGKERLEYFYKDYTRRKDSLSKKEQDVYRDMRIVQEMYARGFDFTPIDIYRALPDRFQIIDGKLMPALNTIEGMGDNAAIAVAEAAKDGKFLSKDDFRQRTKVTKSTIDLMADLGLLGDMPESNQLSLFDFA